MNENNNTSKADAWIANHVSDINQRYRLGYHLMPTVGWMNDPNGLVFFNGQYHAFYQYHPYSSEWGPMHWGHAVSRDMVHWEDLPVALAPGSPADRDGCYSGSAVVNDGVLSLVYTGQVFNSGQIEPFNSDFSETQNLAMSHDGIHFTKFSGNPVISNAPEDNSRNFRDPKVWRHNDRWYVVIGSSTFDDDARALLYRSDDLVEWKYLGVIAQSHGQAGQMWECPDFFELDGQYVLLFSPVGMESKGYKYHNVFQTGYMIGDFDYSTGRLDHGDFEEIDRGHDFYATQTMVAPDGRRICMAWMNMWQTPMREQADGWSGAMTLPRELHLVNGRVTMTPVRELETLRSGLLAHCSDVLQNDTLLAAPDKNQFEVLFSCHDLHSSIGPIGLSLDIGTSDRVKFTYDPTRELLSLDRGGEDGVRAYECGRLDNLNLRIFVDNSSIEVFVNDGLAVFTSRIYPSSPAKVIAVTDGKRAMDVLAYALEAQH